MMNEAKSEGAEGGTWHYFSACVGFFQIHWFPPTDQTRGQVKWRLMSVRPVQGGFPGRIRPRMDGYLCFYMSPVLIEGL